MDARFAAVAELLFDAAFFPLAAVFFPLAADFFAFAPDRFFVAMSFLAAVECYSLRDGHRPQVRRQDDAPSRRDRKVDSWRRGEREAYSALMSAEITLRLARTGDVSTLNALIERSARALSAGFYTEQETESAIRHVFGVDTTLITDETYFVVEREHRVVACGGWSKRRTLYGGDQRPVGERSLLDPATDAARIRAFFVAPEAARQGIGRRLLDACIAAAAQAGFRQLELMATLPGVPLYAACGFREVERVSERLPDGVSLGLVRMTRPIHADDGRGTEPLGRS